MSADVFLFASTTETLGNVVPEAMASGLAVVAYDDATAGQVIRHGDGGLLARLGELSSFRSLARRLAADLAQSRALGLQARAVAERHGWDSIVAALEAEHLSAMGIDTGARELAVPSQVEASPPPAVSPRACPQRPEASKINWTDIQ